MVLATPDDLIPVYEWGVSRVLMGNALLHINKQGFVNLTSTLNAFSSAFPVLSPNFLVSEESAVLRYEWIYVRTPC